MRRLLVPVLAVALLGGAVAVDALRPARPAAPVGIEVPTSGGVLACPVATVGRGKASIHLANVGDAPARARVSIVPAKGKPALLDAEVAPGAAETLTVSGRVKAPATAIVEYGGGLLVASHSLSLSSRAGPRLAAAPCARPSGAQLVIPHLTTLRTDARLALVNPGTAPADVTITLLDDGEVLQPERLQQRVIPPRSRRDFALGDFAFDARDLTAVVTAKAGRVVAEALVEDAAGVALVGAQMPGAEVVTVAARSGSGAAISVVAVGEEDAGVDGLLVSAAEQGRAPKVPAALAPGVASRVAIPARGAGAAAYRFTLTVGSPLAAGSSWTPSTRRSRERSAAEGAAPESRWAGVIGALDPKARVRVTIVNAGDANASTVLRVIGREGVEETPQTVEAGRVLVEPVGSGAGPFAVDVRSDVPVVVLLDVEAPTSTGMMAAGLLATPLRAPSPVAVTIDRRTGVPARSPRG